MKLLILASLITLPLALLGQTSETIWTGNTSTDWSEDSNWTSGAPNSLTKVSIKNTDQNPVHLENNPEEKVLVLVVDATAESSGSALVDFSITNSNLTCTSGIFISSRTGFSQDASPPDRNVQLLLNNSTLSSQDVEIVKGYNPGHTSIVLENKASIRNTGSYYNMIIAAEEVYNEEPPSTNNLSMEIRMANQSSILSQTSIWFGHSDNSGHSPEGRPGVSLTVRAENESYIVGEDEIIAGFGSFSLNNSRLSASKELFIGTLLNIPASFDLKNKAYISSDKAIIIGNKSGTSSTFTLDNQGSIQTTAVNGYISIADRANTQSIIDMTSDSRISATGIDSYVSIATNGNVNLSADNAYIEGNNKVVIAHGENSIANLTLNNGSFISTEKLVDIGRRGNASLNLTQGSYIYSPETIILADQASGTANLSLESGSRLSFRRLLGGKGNASIMVNNATLEMSSYEVGIQNIEFLVNESTLNIDTSKAIGTSISIVNTTFSGDGSIHISGSSEVYQMKLYDTTMQIESLTIGSNDLLTYIYLDGTSTFSITNEFTTYGRLILAPESRIYASSIHFHKDERIQIILGADAPTAPRISAASIDWDSTLSVTLNAQGFSQNLPSPLTVNLVSSPGKSLEGITGSASGHDSSRYQITLHLNDAKDTLQATIIDLNYPSGVDYANSNEMLLYALSNNFSLDENNRPYNDGNTSDYLPIAVLNNGKLQLSFTPLRPELIYQVEQSEDMKNWRTLQTILGGASSEITVPASAGAEDAPKLFLRLKVSEKE